jgi:hypothetical protein
VTTCCPFGCGALSTDFPRLRSIECVHHRCRCGFRILVLKDIPLSALFCTFSRKVELAAESFGNNWSNFLALLIACF